MYVCMRNLIIWLSIGIIRELFECGIKSPGFINHAFYYLIQELQIKAGQYKSGIKGFITRPMERQNYIDVIYLQEKLEYN